MSVEALSPLTSESFATAWNKIDILGRLYKKARSEAVLFAKRHGPIPLGDGRFVGEVVKPGNERFDGDVAYRVLAELRDPDVALQAVGFTATKKGIRDALKESLAEGETLASAERAVHEEIRARGGASRKPSTSVTTFEAKEAKTA